MDESGHSEVEAESIEAGQQGAIECQTPEEAEQIKGLAGEITDCRNVLTAIADETRLQLLVLMLHDHSPRGLRVADLAEKTSLSRPAVSHHLQILKRSGIVESRREGTMIFYYFNGVGPIEDIIGLFTDLRNIVQVMMAK